MCTKKALPLSCNPSPDSLILRNVPYGLVAGETGVKYKNSVLSLKSSCKSESVVESPVYSKHMTAALSRSYVEEGPKITVVIP